MTANASLSLTALANWSGAWTDTATEEVQPMNVDVIFHGGFVITMEGPGTGTVGQTPVGA